MIALSIVPSVLCMQIRYRMFVVFIFKVINLFRITVPLLNEIGGQKESSCPSHRSTIDGAVFKCLDTAVITKTHLTWQHSVGFSVQYLTKLYSLSICVISVCVSR